MRITLVFPSTGDRSTPSQRWVSSTLTQASSFGYSCSKRSKSSFTGFSLFFDMIVLNKKRRCVSDLWHFHGNQGNAQNKVGERGVGFANRISVTSLPTLSAMFLNLPCETRILNSK